MVNGCKSQAVLRQRHCWQTGRTVYSGNSKQMVDVFTGDGALPWHPGQWKAMMLDQLGDHFDQWVTQRLMLDKSPRQ